MKIVKRYLLKNKTKKCSVSTGKMLFDYKTFLLTEYMKMLHSGTLSQNEINNLNFYVINQMNIITDRLARKGYVVKK